MSRRPRPRYQTRFMRGPSSAVAFFTYRFSMVMLKLFSAFATADRTTRPIGSELPLPRFSSSAIASSTGLPWMRSVTRRALRGEKRWNFAEALTSIVLRPRRRGRCRTRGRSRTRCARRDHGRRGFRRRAATVRLEDARRGELAELVADHVLGHKHRHVTMTVVHRDGVTHHRRQDHRVTRPGLHELLLVALVHLLDLLLEGLFNE